MEKGFFHPSRGYWQAIDINPIPYLIITEPERVEIDEDGIENIIPAVTRETTQLAELMASYPDGTIEVPIKPDADHEWIDGEWVYVDPETVVPTVDDYRYAIQSHLDAAAQTRLYDSGTTISTYVNSTNPSWAQEAQAFVAWRDAVWVYAYTELAKVEEGLRDIPTIDALITELPLMVWPE